MEHLLSQWRASWRDTLLLLGEFRKPLLLFIVAIFGFSSLYAVLAISVGEPLDNLPQAFYHILTLAFLQPTLAFPYHPLLQAFYFIMPLIGFSILAQGLADFGILLFNRRARSKEWEMAVASTFSKHTILVGLGHLGFRVVQKLHRMGEQVVAIELNPSSDLFATVQKMDVPVIHDDAIRQAALEAAGVRRARTIVLCTQNDSLNLQIAVKARSLNPEIQVVLRIFDDDFAQSLQEQFGFLALSATGMAAPAFAAAAAGADVTRPISIEGHSLSLARLSVSPGSPLAGNTVTGVEQGYDLSIILLKRAGEPDLHPTGERRLEAGDTLAVLGSPEQINALVHDNQ
ncbi:MAG: hypothetical protein FJZ96_13990 [Chloroflexi bacterium]|nr:hypothetical protein [Chloroflexota bacterium]